MSYPPKYDPSTTFAQQQFTQETLPKHDVEYDNIAQSIDAIVENLKCILREDCRLKNCSVHVNALDGDVLAMMSNATAGWNYQGDWQAGKSYLQGDLVRSGDAIYYSLGDHVSGTNWECDICQWAQVGIIHPCAPDTSGQVWRDFTYYLDMNAIYDGTAGNETWDWTPTVDPDWPACPPDGTVVSFKWNVGGTPPVGEEWNLGPATITLNNCANKKLLFKGAEVVAKDLVDGRMNLAVYNSELDSGNGAWELQSSSRADATGTGGTEYPPEARLFQGAPILVSGFEVTRTSGTVLTLGSGACKTQDSTKDAVWDIWQPEDMAKTINLAWSQGANGGALLGGATLAEGCWGLFALMDSTGVNPVDWGMQNVWKNPTLPAGYDKYRLVSSWRINSALEASPGEQDGSRFYWQDTGAELLDVQHTFTTPGNPNIIHTGTILAPPTSRIGCMIEQKLGSNVATSVLVEMHIFPRKAGSPNTIGTYGVGSECERLDEVGDYYRFSVDGASQMDVSCFYQSSAGGNSVAVSIYVLDYVMRARGRLVPDW